MNVNEKKSWKSFVQMVLKIKTPRQFEEFAEFVFTQEERDQLATRILLTRELLKEDKTQRQIADEFNISIAKITRGSNSIKRLSDKLRNFLKQHC